MHLTGFIWIFVISSPWIGDFDIHPDNFIWVVLGQINSVKQIFRYSHTCQDQEIASNGVYMQKD